MESICLFEAGGTKTTLLISMGKQVNRFELPGFNPNRYSPDFERALEKIDLPSEATVFFYGSGLASETNKETVHRILAEKFIRKVEINHDQLGAARAVWGNSEGLIGIMGTGAFVAWYDGEKLLDRKGGHGYLIDDIGGGFEMGKIILSAWLNNDLPAMVDKAVADFVKIDKTEFTTVFYKNPDLQLVAGLSEVIHPYSGLAEIRSLLVTYFNMYFSRHVSPVLKKHASASLGLVGGIAEGFEEIVRLAAAQSGISEIKVVGNPAGRLLEYHCRIKS